MNICFTGEGFDDYNFWVNNDRKMLKRINVLIKDIARNGAKGLGKAEILKYDFAKCYSRRINKEHRLIFCMNGNDLIIVSCKTHYGKE